MFQVYVIQYIIDSWSIVLSGWVGKTETWRSTFNMQLGVCMYVQKLPYDNKIWYIKLSWQAKVMKKVIHERDILNSIYSTNCYTILHFI